MEKDLPLELPTTVESRESGIAELSADIYSLPPEAQRALVPGLQLLKRLSSVLDFLQTSTDIPSQTDENIRTK